MTLNKFLRHLKQTVESHAQIRSYTFGDPWEWAQKNQINGVAVLCSIDGTRFNSAEMIVSVSLYFMDMCADDEFNEQDILSDTLSIARDIHAQLRDPAGEYEAAEESSLQPFVEYDGNSMAGWKMTIDITWPNELNRCDIP